MKIALLSVTGIGSCILDHCDTAYLAKEETEGAVQFADDLFAQTTKPCINTCLAARNYMLDKTTQDKVNKLLNLGGKTESYIFGLFNGTRFSDFLEIRSSRRLMVGELGPELPFSCGIGQSPNIPFEEAFTNLISIREFISSLSYKGEVCFGISDNFRITEIGLGHFPYHFAMFCEEAKNSIVDVIAFMQGSRPKAELYKDSVVVANIVSRSPYPLLAPTGKIEAPRSAEKHLWRLRLGKTEIVLITVHGKDTYVASQRMWATLENLLDADRSLQVRTDFIKQKPFLLTNATPVSTGP